jgi:hypothetical protein
MLFERRPKTLRSTTLIFTALLLLASMGVARHSGSERCVGHRRAHYAVVAPAEDSSSCNLLLAKLGISPLDSAKDASTYPACGNCSDLTCRGKSIYDFCGGTIRQPMRCRTADVH